MELPANMLRSTLCSSHFPAPLALLILSSDQIFWEAVIKGFKGLDDVTIHVRGKGLYFPPVLSIP